MFLECLAYVSPTQVGNVGMIVFHRKSKLGSTTGTILNVLLYPVETIPNHFVGNMLGLNTNIR